MSIGEDIVEEQYEMYVIPQYKDLLKQCLRVLNFIPNQKIEGKNTYILATEIENLLNKK